MDASLSRAARTRAPCCRGGLASRALARTAAGLQRAIARRRGNHIAAVAVARKLAVIVWHMLTKDEDYAGSRPALHAKKLRDLELHSSLPARQGQREMATNTT